MSVEWLNIGDIECAVLHEGESDLIAKHLAERYPGVSPAEIEAALAGAKPAGSLNLPYIHSGGQHIIADVGFGEMGRPSAGGVEAALASLGLAAADIDIVFLTHFHGDHIAGLVDESGALSFPKARYLSTQAEWDEWIGRWSASAAPQDQVNLQRFSSLQERFSFVSAGDEIAPGVTVLDLAGHTLGHAGLLLESGGERLLHLVDILHQPFQFANVGWHFSFDSDPYLAEETRRRTLQRCADEAILTLFYHMPFPGLGRVTVEGDAFAWNPIA